MAIKTREKKKMLSTTTTTVGLCCCGPPSSFSIPSFFAINYLEAMSSGESVDPGAASLYPSSSSSFCLTIFGSFLLYFFFLVLPRKINAPSSG